MNNKENRKRLASDSTNRLPVDAVALPIAANKYSNYDQH
jgi:hypothetical protein